MKNIIYHIKRGKTSNYPICDIIYFLIRYLILDIFLKLNIIKTEMVVKLDDGYYHIACPFCKFKNKLLKIKPHYFHCNNCNEEYLNLRVCKKCNITLRSSQLQTNGLVICNKIRW